MTTFRLLINTPSGRQEITEVTETGKYFDPSRVLWDERVDGAMPAITVGKMQRVGNELVEAADFLPAHLAAVRAENVPAVVTMRQCRLALLNASLLGSVDTFIETQDADKRIYWEYSTEVRRNHPLVDLVRDELGMTDDQIDDLFILAGNID